VFSSSGKVYYAKTGTPNDRGAYTTEAESLKALNLASPGLVPKLLAFGFADENGRETDGGGRDSPFFITEYKHMTSLTEHSGAVLGRRLATEVHNYASPKGFGSEVVPYYGGATRLRNGWFKSWEKYVDALIADLLATLEARGGFSDLCRKGQDIRARRVSLGCAPGELCGSYLAEKGYPRSPSSTSDQACIIARWFMGMSPGAHEDLPTDDGTEWERWD
jgi:fructosamine-3-kinase